jgi:hypothetical protein
MRENCTFRLSGGRRRALQWAPPPTRHAAPSGLDASQTAVEIAKNTAAVSLGERTPMFPRINFDTQGREKMRVTRMKRAHPFGQEILHCPRDYDDQKHPSCSKAARETDGTTGTTTCVRIPDAKKRR